MNTRSKSALTPTPWASGVAAIALAALTVGSMLVVGPAHAATSNEQVTRAVTDGMAFVEKIREMNFKSTPKVSVLNDAAFVSRVDQERKTDPSYAKDIAEFTALLRALNLVTGKGDPARLLDALFSGGVGGFYDPKAKELVVRAGEIGPLARAIIVHELTHALDDQYFGLDRPELAKRIDDSESAFQFFVEGTARFVENKYRDTFTAAERTAATNEETAMATQGELLTLVADPAYTRSIPFMIQSLLSPYEQGKIFVRDLVAADGIGGIANVYKRVPVTTEQAIEFRRYRANERPIIVRPPEVPTGATVISRGLVGEAGLEALFAGLESLGAPERVDAAAQGWGGDAYVLWQKSGKVCLRMDLAMDTPRDLAEARTALTKFAGNAGNAKVETRAKNLVRLTSCGTTTG
jgi:hypothetical protein